MADANSEKEELLPLPSKNLPLPEKELPENAEKRSFLGSKWIRIALIAVIIAIVVSGAYFLGKTTVNQQLACTLDAKICPDGTSVGRTGPKCEFSPCLSKTQASATANWKTYNNTRYKFSLKYPSSWKAEEYNELSEMPPGYILRIETSSKTPGYGFYSANLNVMSKPQDQSLEDFAEPESCIGEGTGGCVPTKASKQEIVQINDIQALWQEALYGQGNFDAKVFIPHGNYVFIFQIPNAAFPDSPVKQDLASLNVFKNILTTFKFTDSNKDVIPTPSCRPRPACLDAAPRCLIPETSDMCPSTITPSP